MFLGGALTDTLGWRSVLFVNVPLGVLVLVLGGMALPSTPRTDRPEKRLDVPGALTVTAALAALVYGVVGTESYSWGSTHTLAVFAGALALLVTAGVIEWRASDRADPVRDPPTRICCDGHRDDAGPRRRDDGDDLLRVALPPAGARLQSRSTQACC